MQDVLIFSVSEFTRHIKGTLEAQYADVWVEGELSNLRLPASGHSYMTLKDAGSQLRAVMFRYARKTLRFTPEDGMQIVCRGRVNVYEPRGEYQLVIDRMEPRGVGALQLAFEQLKKKLAAEGLFDEAHKKPLPFLPQRIGVITSASGAAVRDIIQVLTRRFPGLSIRILPVAVQGDDAAPEIAAAIACANEQHAADVLIVGRGGGSFEDLWAFNEERVALAIFQSEIPVISAVGHEIDFTIADFVADVRAPTPSAAAELAVREKQELARGIGRLTARLRQHLLQQIALRRTRVRAATARLGYPARRIADLQLRHDEQQQRLMHALPRLLDRKQTAAAHARGGLLARVPQQRIAALRAAVCFLKAALRKNVRFALERKSAHMQRTLSHLSALNPAEVLARGFGIVREQPSGRAVRSAAQLQTGDRLQVVLHRGSVDCLVEKVYK